MLIANKNKTDLSCLGLVFINTQDRYHIWSHPDTADISHGASIEIPVKPMGWYT